ncbi:MAG: imidazolonepropionase [Gemmatimonadota bacterium]|nr:imidazolonepropionase [Gemmatimonadota bacterium]
MTIATAPALASLRFVNAAQVATCAGPSMARRGSAMANAGLRRGVSVAVRGSSIAMVDEPGAVERAFPDATILDCGGRLLTPGLIDSHTHAIFGRSRADEQELRAAGESYMEIARRGGGIHASVRDVRRRDEAELAALARARLGRLASFGTTTVEVKSGYGLTTSDELKLLRVIARLSGELSLRLVPTWLGAHEIPEEYRGRAEGRASYVNLLTEEMLPAVASAGLARFADIFCEPGVFSPDETRIILGAARRHGLALKLHADELSPSGGAELAATSADHLAAISHTGIRALAESATVATLLPGTMLFLGKSTLAPARALIDSGAAVALATDFNPGTSPTPNFPLILTLGVSQLRMSASEVLIAATVNGAAALDLARETGQIAAGFSADLALWEAEDIRELPYWYGDRRCIGSWVRGKACHPCELPLS